MPNEERPTSTLADVARVAGVHVSTASRILHAPGRGRPPASPETAERVRRAAAELNYRRDPTAVRLRTGRGHEMAVVVPRLSDLVLATMYEGIQERAQELGYTTYVSNSHDDQALRAELSESALRRRVDGLIFGDAHLDPAFFDTLDRRSIKFVLVNRRCAAYPSVTCNDFLGGAQVAEHFVSLGHRAVAVIGGWPWASTSADRCAGFVERMSALGIEVPESHIIQNGFDAEAGMQAGRKLLQQKRGRPTAVFAVNDFTAIGLMGAIRAAGLQIGRDVAVAGYNDTPLAAVLPLPLTSVRSPMLQIGRQAASHLAALLAGQSVESVTFDPELVVRESSAT